MDKNLKWRIILILIVISISCLYFAPSFVKLPSWWESTFPSEKVSLGLDLQGGMHLLLEVETEKALSNNVDRLVSDLKDILLEERIRFDRLEFTSNLAGRFGLDVPQVLVWRTAC